MPYLNIIYIILIINILKEKQCCLGHGSKRDSQTLLYYIIIEYLR